MSSSDKTRQKLLDTMRRTKTESSSKPAATTADKVEAKQDKPAEKKTTKTAQSTKKRTAATKKTATADPYSSTGRIWPD